MAFTISSTMKLKIDKAGRVVIPKSLRERFGFKHGVGVEAYEEGNGLILKAASAGPSMVREKGLLVHQGKPLERLDWQRIIEEVREERHRAILEP
ncbi:MAG: AbrB/MazE/SpoVT family DNA-binding domain-containing protein [Candidatus Binataceae bacterium]